MNCGTILFSNNICGGIIYIKIENKQQKPTLSIFIALSYLLFIILRFIKSQNIIWKIQVMSMSSLSVFKQWMSVILTSELYKHEILKFRFKSIKRFHWWLIDKLCSISAQLWARASLSVWPHTTTHHPPIPPTWTVSSLWSDLSMWGHFL